MQICRDLMPPDQITERIIVDQMVAQTSSVHLTDRTEMLTFKVHNQDRAANQLAIIHQEAQMDGNRMVVLPVIQVVVSRQEIQILVDPLVVDPASKNQLPADLGSQIHDNPKNQTEVAEEEIDLPLTSPMID